MEKYDIIVIAGQSNAEGHGIGNVTREYIPTENVRILYDENLWLEEINGGTESRWRTRFPLKLHIGVAQEPVINGEKFGRLQFHFAKAYHDACLQGTDRKVLIIQAAVGGSAFLRREWGVEDKNLYDRLVDMTRYALSLNPDNRLAAFLWHQGESDALMCPEMEPWQRRAVHRANLGAMIDAYQKEFRCRGIPMVAAGFCQEWYEKNREAADAVLEAIRDVFVPRNGVVLDTADLKSNNQQTGNCDDIHFCRESLHILGRRYFAAFQELVTQSKNSR